MIDLAVAGRDFNLWKILPARFVATELYYLMDEILSDIFVVGSTEAKIIN